MNMNQQLLEGDRTGMSKTTPMWMKQVRRVEAFEIAETIGIDQWVYRGKGKRIISPCPACGAVDKARITSSYPSGRWSCKSCGISDVGNLDFVALHLFGKRMGELDSDEQTQAQAWCASHGWCVEPT